MHEYELINGDSSDVESYSVQHAEILKRDKSRRCRDRSCAALAISCIIALSCITGSVMYGVFRLRELDLHGLSQEGHQILDNINNSIPQVIEDYTTFLNNVYSLVYGVAIQANRTLVNSETQVNGGITDFVTDANSLKSQAQLVLDAFCNFFKLECATYST